MLEQHPGMCDTSRLAGLHLTVNGREGTNALDAAFLAYSGISVLRQQIKPDHRVHGIIQGQDLNANGSFLH